MKDFEKEPLHCTLVWNKRKFCQQRNLKVFQEIRTFCETIQLNSEVINNNKEESIKDSFKFECLSEI